MFKKIVFELGELGSPKVGKVVAGRYSSSAAPTFLTFGLPRLSDFPTNNYICTL